jgi:hypothetical protein
MMEGLLPRCPVLYHYWKLEQGARITEHRVYWKQLRVHELEAVAGFHECWVFFERVDAMQK